MSLCLSHISKDFPDPPPCFDFSFILPSLSTFLILPLHLGNDTAVWSFPIGCNPDVAQKQMSASRWLVLVWLWVETGAWKCIAASKVCILWDVYADSVQQHRQCSTMTTSMYLGHKCPYGVVSCMFRQWGLYGWIVIPSQEEAKMDRNYEICG